MCFELNNGIPIPAIGLGTWQAPNDHTVIQAIRCAVEAGYRHIDTATVYGNEKSVGKGIRECGIGRGELFVTSKVWNSERGYDSTLRAFDKSMEDLQLEYLDLYLIHWPASARRYENWKQINAETWRAMEKLCGEGRVRSIGVSNFLPCHLVPLLEYSTIRPAVDQIEFHPGFMQAGCVEFCKAHHILVEAWSPLGTGKMLGNRQLQALAVKYGKSTAQLCVRWSLQHGVLPLPKSITPDRIRENINVADFTISPEDMRSIDAMEYCGGSGLHPDTFES